MEDFLNKSKFYTRELAALTSVIERKLLLFDELYISLFTF